MGITLNRPDFKMKVLVKAPTGTKVEKIKEKVTKRASWILKQLNFFLSFHPKTPARKFIAGETHFFLGRQYLLKVSIGKKNTVGYKGRNIKVITKDKSKVKHQVKQWYKAHAKNKFAEIAEPLIQRFKKYKVEPTGIHIQEMSKRWGICTTKGKIILNPELIKAPKKCIEYVIVHELCHLVHHNHSQKFIVPQTKEMPDWEQWKEKLEKIH